MVYKPVALGVPDCNKFYQSPFLIDPNRKVLERIHVQTRSAY